MRLSLTLSSYVAKNFVLWFCGTLLALAAFILLFDTVELFRRTAANEAATFQVVLAMGLLKLPNMIERTFPFSILFAAMLTLWRLNRHQELVVTRAIGVSVWQLLLPMTATAVLLGAIKLAAFNPFAAALFARYQEMEHQYVGRQKSAFAALTGKSIWFRQETAEGHYVMHAREIVPTSGTLGDVMVLLMRGEDSFVGRIDADRARLGIGYWVLTDATIHMPNMRPRELPFYRLETDLTLEKIQDSFANPATLSFWKLPAFIGVLKAAGFSALRHKLHWQVQLASPLLLAAIVLVAATFSLRPMRRGGTRVLIASGLVCGFALFMMMDVVAALGVAARIPIWLAAWSPVMVAALLGSAMLFHLEDG